MVKMKKSIRFRLCKKIAGVCILSILASNNASSQVSSKKAKSDTSETAEKRSLSYTIIHADQNSFGYNIFNKGALIVHQPSIPGQPGNLGFSSKQDAVKAAKLVMNKISQNIFPPTVTKKELDSLQIKL